MRSPLRRWLAAGFVLIATRAVAGTPRYAHTTSLLASGQMLVVGGLDNTGAYLKTAELINTNSGGADSSTGAMSVARASHTATVLPNGDVLVTGGINSGGVQSSIEVYTPSTGLWTLLGNMTTPRYNHTATLLNSGANSGSVLLCGGQTDTLGTVTNSCDLFKPGAPGAGTISAGPPMQAARALHTAVLLTDGSVWVAGGWNPAATGTGGYLPTTERLPVGAASFNLLAAALNEARAYHTATVMGDGRVLIAGGHNNDDSQADKGFLQSTEIYDPVNNVIVPAAPMSVRRAMHTATLLANGSVELRGGLGNITTSYLKVSGTSFLSPSQLTDTLIVQSTGLITGVSAVVSLPQIPLSVPAAGTIVDGDIFYSSPTATFTSGLAELTPGDPGNPSAGLRTSLNGVTVKCVAGVCGLIPPFSATLTNINGSVLFKPVTVSPTIAITGGNTTFSSALTQAAGTVPITPASSVDASIQFTLPPELIGATLSSATLTVTAGSLVQPSSYSVTYSGGFANIPAGTVVGTGGIVSAAVTFQQLSGIATWLGVDQSGSVPIPESATTPTLSFTGTLNYTASSVDLSVAGQFTVDVATIVIRSMVLASAENYREKTNSTTLEFSFPGGVPLFESMQQTTTLTPDGDLYSVGGNDCDSSGTCATFIAKNSGPPNYKRSDEIQLETQNSFTGTGTLNVARAFHTATMLPKGDILVAGGENAPNAPLSSAEIYYPARGAFKMANGPMSIPRSNHTANLLVNGRVLIAGGFTNTPSTGPTNVAEIFYPDTQIFEPTAPMNFARANHTATTMPDGSVIVVGGQGFSGNYLSSVEVYSSTSVYWSTLAALPNPIAYHTATLLTNGKLLVVGGLNILGATTQVLSYDPATNIWTALASLPVALYQHTATLLANGEVLVAGGNDGNGEANVSYVYDPVGNTWNATGGASPLTTARFGHDATLLPDGSVMISGGYTAHGSASVASGIEIFHVDVSSWIPIGPFNTGPRAAHTMTLSANGEVYAIGGSNGVVGTGSVILNTAEFGYFALSPDYYTSGTPPSLRQSTITAISASPFLASGNLNVTGTGFSGGTEASGGGAASANSSFNAPRLILQAIDSSGGSASQSNSGRIVDLTPQVYANYATNGPTLNTSLTVPTPSSAGLPAGWYSARVSANDVYANGASLQVGPALPSAAPSAITGFALGTSSISWSWGTVAGPIGGYDVYQATSSVFIGTAPVSGPSIVQTGLQPNTTGSISVAAYTLSGDGPLLFSSTYYTLAAAPTLVQISSVTPSSVLVQWNLSNNAPGTIYEISQSTDDFVSSYSTPVPSSLFVTTNSYTISSLSPATTYYFRMRAFNAQNIPSVFSSTVSVQTTSGVGGIVGVALTPSSIQWSWSATPGATSYDIFVATTGQLAGTSTSTVFTDTSLGVDTPRGVLVGAVTSAGLGPLSTSATVYTLANPPSATFPDYIALSTGGFVANWYSNGNPPSLTYNVNVYTVGVGTSTLVVSTVTTKNQFIAVSGLTPSQYAQVDVYAYNGNGVPSSPYIMKSTYTFAAAPTSLAIIANTANAISVDWSTSGNSTTTFYQLTYSTDDFVTNVATAVPFALGENISSKTISGLVTSTTYWIVVQAENKLGQLSSFSNTVTTVTFNGGAAPGLLQGILPAATTGQISGTLGNGQFISLASQSGSFPTNTLVTISSYNVASTLCPGAVNMGVALNDNPPYMPLRALMLTLGGFAVSPSSPTLSTTVTLLRYVPSSGVCVPLNTTFNALAQTLTAEINDFGIFVVAAPPSFGSAATARAYPNPYHVNRDGYVTIDQIPPGSRVRVMDLRGDTVLDQTADSAGLVTWSATNGAGRNVSSGLYLVLIEGGGTKKILKLAVIR